MTHEEASHLCNISQEEGILQVLITGGVHDMQDIAFPPQTEDKLNAVQSELSETFAEIGLKFDAGV